MRRGPGYVIPMAMFLALLAGPSAGVSAEGIEVVFLAGEGFMVSCGHSKVLIDALFDLNDDEGKPPGPMTTCRPTASRR